MSKLTVDGRDRSLETGLLIGLAVGIVIGLVLDSFAFGIAIGVSLGIALGCCPQAKGIKKVSGTFSSPATSSATGKRFLTPFLASASAWGLPWVVVPRRKSTRTTSVRV